MRSKPGLSPLTQKEKNQRRIYLQTINNAAFASCDNRGNNVVYNINKIDCLQKELIEIGAIFGGHYLNDVNISLFNSKPDIFVDKVFERIPKNFSESDFVCDNINFLKRGISIGARRKISNSFVESNDNDSSHKIILDFINNNTPNLINSISHDEVQVLMFLGRHLNSKNISLSANIQNIWILIGYYDDLYDALKEALDLYKKRKNNGEDDEHKIR